LVYVSGPFWTYALLPQPKLTSSGIKSRQELPILNALIGTLFRNLLGPELAAEHCGGGENQSQVSHGCE
jgi:hypothetical protein